MKNTSHWGKAGNVSQWQDMYLASAGTGDEVWPAAKECQGVQSQPSLSKL